MIERPKIVTALMIAVVWIASMTVVAAAQDRVELTVLAGYAPDAFEPVLEMFEVFESNHPNVTIEYIQATANVNEQAITMHAGGNPADVIITGGIPQLEGAGILHYLDDLERADPWDDRSEVFDSLDNLFVSRNGRFALPWGGDTEIMFYNVSHFQSAGMAAPGSDITFTEFRDTLRNLMRDENGDGVPERYGFRGIPWGWESWLWSNGGQWVDDELNPTRISFNDAAVEAVRYRQALRYVDRLEAPEGESTTLFTEGTVSVAARGMGLVQGILTGEFEVPFEWGLFLWPTGEGATRGVRFGVPGLGIGAGTEHPELAWKLAKFLASSDTVNRLLEAGFNTGVPVLANVDYADLLVRQADQANTPLPEGFELITEAPKFARPQTWCFSVGNDACQAVNETIRALTFGNEEIAAVEPALEEVSRRATAFLQEYQSH